MRTIQVIAAASLILSGSELAYSADGAAKADATKSEKTTSVKVEHSADQFVRDVSKSVIEILKSGGSESQKKTKLTQMFHETMDIDWIAKFVVGRYWKDMSADQQQDYMKNYKDYLTASYVPIFKDYNGQNIVIKSVKPIGTDSYLVVTDIKSNNSDVPYKVEYRIKYTEGGYKIRDIIAEGVSMITTQRSEFGSIVGNDGVASLNSQLAAKAKELR